MVVSGEERLLLLDTCGERASLALVQGGGVIAERELAERTASGSLLGAIREVLGAAGLQVAELSGVGVVSGPGSFTGVRVGLAMAKGLCEAGGVRLAAVSRLAVLADASGLTQGIAVLWAGREQVYVREIVGGRERLMDGAVLVEQYRPCDAAYAEEAVAPWLRDGLRARPVAIRAALSLELVRRCLAEGGSDLARVDANYVRNEEAIYARQLARG